MTRLWKFFEEHKEGVLKSWKDDKSRWNKHIGPSIGRKLVDDLVTLDIDRISVRMRKTHSPATVRQVISLIQRVMRFGEVKGQITPPPRSRLNFSMPKVNNLSTEDLSPDQLSHLLDVLDNHDNLQIANLMKLALFTGMRRGELFRLKWEHIDYDHGFIKLIGPKSGTDQKIPLNDAAREVLESHELLGSNAFCTTG